MTRARKKVKQKPTPEPSNLSKYRIHIVILFSILVFTAYTFAQAENIESAMKDLCVTATQLLAVGSMLLVILAAAVYAIGQIVGAETRARASVYATAMITGAVIGIVIYLILPPLIETMLGQKIDCKAATTTPDPIGSGSYAVKDPLSKTTPTTTTIPTT